MSRNTKNRKHYNWWAIIIAIVLLAIFIYCLAYVYLSLDTYDHNPLTNPEQQISPSHLLMEGFNHLVKLFSSK